MPITSGPPSISPTWMSGLDAFSVRGTLLFKPESAGQARPDLIDYILSDRHKKTSADLAYKAQKGGVSLFATDPLYIVILSAAKDLGFESAVLLTAQIWYWMAGGHRNDQVGW